MAEYIDKVQAINIIASGKNDKAYFGTTDKDWEVIDFLKAVPTTDAISIPDGATNGEVIKAMFPNLRVEDNGGSIYLRYPDGGWIVYDRKWWNWWNAPYKKED